MWGDYLGVESTIEYEGVRYKVVETLNDGLVLTVLESEYEEGKFPLQTYVLKSPQFN